MYKSKQGKYYCDGTGTEISGVLHVPYGSNNEQQQAAESDDSEGDEENDPWADFEEMETSDTSVRSRIPKERAVNIKDDCGKVHICKGKFPLTQVYWKVTVKVNKCWMRSAPIYAIRTDGNVQEQKLVTIFLTDCLKDYFKKNLQDVQRDSVMACFEAFCRLTDKESTLCFTNLEDTLEEYVLQERLKGCCLGKVQGTYGQHVQEDHSYYIKEIMRKSDLCTVVLYAARYPHLVKTLSSLLPYTFIQFLHKLSLIENKKTATNSVLQLACEMAEKTPWEFVFKDIINTKLKIQGTEASLASYKNAGFLPSTPQTEKDSIYIYEVLKVDTRKNGHTYMSFSRLRNCNYFNKPLDYQIKGERWNKAFEYLENNKVIKKESFNRDKNIFLRYNWQAEVDTVNGLERILKKHQEIPNRWAVDYKSPDLENIFSDPDQLKAIQLMASSPIAVLSGKGGCGKTTVVTALLKHMYEQEERKEVANAKDENNHNAEFAWDDDSSLMLQCENDVKKEVANAKDENNHNAEFAWDDDSSLMLQCENDEKKEVANAKDENNHNAEFAWDDDSSLMLQCENDVKKEVANAKDENNHNAEFAWDDDSSLMLQCENDEKKEVANAKDENNHNAEFAWDDDSSLMLQCENDEKKEVANAKDENNHNAEFAWDDDSSLMLQCENDEKKEVANAKDENNHNAEFAWDDDSSLMLQCENDEKKEVANAKDENNHNADFARDNNSSLMLQCENNEKKEVANAKDENNHNAEFPWDDDSSLMLQCENAEKKEVANAKDENNKNDEFAWDDDDNSLWMLQCENDNVTTLDSPKPPDVSHINTSCKSPTDSATNCLDNIAAVPANNNTEDTLTTKLNMPSQCSRQSHNPAENVQSSHFSAQDSSQSSQTHIAGGSRWSHLISPANSKEQSLIKEAISDLKKIVKQAKDVYNLTLEDYKKRILLTAPTGKAAKLLGLKANLHSATLHSVIMSWRAYAKMLYKSESTEITAWNYSEVEVLVVDECSLLSIRLFACVINILLKKASLRKIILLGDVRQLPSIEAGNFLTDVFSAFKDMSNGQISLSVELTSNHRSESQLIVDNAGKISHKDMPTFNDEQRFHLIKLSDNADDNERDQAIRHLLNNAEDIRSHLDSQFITGASLLGQCKEKLCNGEVFFIMDEIDHFSKNSANEKDNVPVKHLVLSDRDPYRPRVVCVTLNVLKRKCRMKHSWAKTIHTFQGSESDSVVYVLGKAMPQDWQHVYTAVTRGKKSVYIIGSWEQLYVAVSRQPPSRHSRLRYRLDEMIKIHKTSFLDSFSIDNRKVSTPVDIDDMDSNDSWVEGVDLEQYEQDADKDENNTDVKVSNDSVSKQDSQVFGCDRINDLNQESHHRRNLSHSFNICNSLDENDNLNGTNEVLASFYDNTKADFTSLSGPEALSSSQMNWSSENNYSGTFSKEALNICSDLSMMVETSIVSPNKIDLSVPGSPKRASPLDNSKILFTPPRSKTACSTNSEKESLSNKNSHESSPKVRRTDNVTSTPFRNNFSQSLTLGDGCDDSDNEDLPSHRRNNVRKTFNDP